VQAPSYGRSFSSLFYYDIQSFLPSAPVEPHKPTPEK
jgi:hypothetical protein